MYIKWIQIVLVYIDKFVKFTLAKNWTVINTNQNNKRNEIQSLKTLHCCCFQATIDQEKQEYWQQIKNLQYKSKAKLRIVERRFVLVAMLRKRNQCKLYFAKPGY